jgi:hypothetical protein
MLNAVLARVLIMERRAGLTFNRDRELLNKIRFRFGETAITFSQFEQRQAWAVEIVHAGRSSSRFTMLRGHPTLPVAADIYSGWLAGQDDAEKESLPPPSETTT